MAFAVNKVSLKYCNKCNENILIIVSINFLFVLRRQTAMKLFWHPHMMFKNLIFQLCWLLSLLYGLGKNMTESLKGRIISLGLQSVALLWGCMCNTRVSARVNYSSVGFRLLYKGVREGKGIIAVLHVEEWRFWGGWVFGVCLHGPVK